MEEICTLQIVLKFIKDYDILIIVVLNIIGWVVVYLLNNRTQRKNILLQVKNDARLKITTSLREYQNWLFDFKDLIYAFRALKHENDIKVKLKSIIDNIDKLFEKQTIIYKWVFYIEEYIILFPIKKRDIEYLGKSYDKTIINMGEVRRNILAIYRGDDKQIDDDFLKNKQYLLQKDIRLINDLIICYQRLFLKTFDEYSSSEQLKSELFHDQVTIEKNYIKICSKEY